MPIQPSRASLPLRLFAACTALLITVQLVSGPAAAAPAREDAELTVTPLDDDDEAVVEPIEEAEEAVAESAEDVGEAEAVGPVDGAGEEAVEAAQDEDEPAIEAAQDQGEPAVEAEEATAEPVEVAEEPAGGPAHDVQVIAAPSRHDDPVVDPFLLRLLDAINERRERNGIRPLAFVPASANAALDSFFARTATGLGWPGPCGHDFSDGVLAWDAVVAAGFGGSPRGEVLACPGPEPYWTPDRAAEQWWESPIHFDVLYADDASSSIACSAYGVQGGASESGKNKRKSGGPSGAASAVICVTFQG
jgi:hypothetical protein